MSGPPNLALLLTAASRIAGVLTAFPACYLLKAATAELQSLGTPSQISV